MKSGFWHHLFRNRYFAKKTFFGELYLLSIEFIKRNFNFNMAEFLFQQAAFRNFFNTGNSISTREFFLQHLKTLNFS